MKQQKQQMNNSDYWDNEFTRVYNSIARRGKNCTKGIPCGNSCQKKGSVCRKNLMTHESERYDRMAKYVSQYDNMVKKGKPMSDVQKSEHTLVRKERDRLARLSQKAPGKARSKKIASDHKAAEWVREQDKALQTPKPPRGKQQGSRHLESFDSEVFIDSRYPNLLGVEYVRELTDDLPDATIVVSDYETGVVSNGEFIPISLRELDTFFGEDDEGFTRVYGSTARRGKNCTKGVPCGNSCQKRGSACRKNMSAMDIRRFDNMTKAIKKLDRLSQKPGGLTKAQASEKSLWEKEKKKIAWNSKNKD